MIVKIHKTSDGKKVVAVCDDDILGKKFEEGKLQLDLSSDFYAGEVIDDIELGDILKDADVVNIVGKISVDFIRSFGFVEDDKILSVDGIPHAQIILN